MAKKIRDRKEFFLGKIAGREDVDVNTLMPPGASSTEEELLLEIAGRIDGIETNSGSGGSGEGSGAGLPSVEGSGKALVSVNGEFVEQDGYGYTVSNMINVYDSSDFYMTELSSENPLQVEDGYAYSIFGDDNTAEEAFGTDNYLNVIDDSYIVPAGIYYNVTFNGGVEYKDVPLENLIIHDPEFGDSAVAAYIGGALSIDNPSEPTFGVDFSEFPFSILIFQDDTSVRTLLITQDDFNYSQPELKITTAKNTVNTIDSKYIDASGVIKSNTVFIYQQASNSNNENFDKLLEEWCTDAINNQLDDVDTILLEEKISAFNISYMVEKYVGNGQFAGKECLKCISVSFNYSDTDTADMGTIQFVFQRLDGESLSPIRLIYSIDEEDGGFFFDPDEWTPI